MKKISSLLFLLFVSTVAMAADSDDKWTVFDVASKAETAVDLSDKEDDGLVSCAIVGKDDREDITGKAQSYEKAVVVLEQNFSQGRALCSGAMVAPNVVLTAAHCVTQQGKMARGVDVFAVGVSAYNKDDSVSRPRDSEGTPQQGLTEDQMIKKFFNRNYKSSNRADSLQGLANKIRTMAQEEEALSDAGDQFLRPGNYPTAKSTKIWVPQKYIEYTRNKKDSKVDLNKEELYDYALVILDRNMGNTTGWLGLSVESAGNLKNRTIVVLGRGGDKPAKSLWVGKGTIGQVDAHYISHNADQIGGNSGGPITFYRDRSHIIALANFGAARKHVPQGYVNGGLRINKQIIKAVKSQK